MLARKKLPQDFLAWNRHWGAPFGRRLPFGNRVVQALPLGYRARLQGLFAFQGNNATRAFEYPWAFYAAPCRPGDRVLEIGGGLSGFQFALAKAGCKVTNVDPDREGAGSILALARNTMENLNRAFGTQVELLDEPFETLSLPACSFDRIYSISVIEHFDQSIMTEVALKIFDLLKPGGIFIVTADLFLNLAPFTSRQSNEWGTNKNMMELSRVAPFERLLGIPDELCGFAEFDKEKILSNLETYLIGTYPCLVQCLVLRKPH